jgi:hypothetical protein
MARINIEDSLYKDGRFTELCIQLKSKWAALGALFEAWAFAQDFVEIENPTGLVLIEDWKKRKICDLILDVGLADIRDDKIYMRGAEEQFHWLVEAKIKGRKGGQAQHSPTKPSLSSTNLSPSSAKPLPLYSPSSSKENNYNSLRAKSGPEEVARRIQAGIQLHGPDDREGLRKYVGNEIFEKIAKGCGWAAIRELRRDSFTLMNISKMLGG